MAHHGNPTYRRRTALLKQVKLNELNLKPVPLSLPGGRDGLEAYKYPAPPRRPQQQQPPPKSFLRLQIKATISGFFGPLQK